MIAAAQASDTDLQGFIEMRQSVVEGLLGEIRAAAGTGVGSPGLIGSAPSRSNPTTSLMLDRMAKVIDTFTVGYASTVDEIRERIGTMRSLLPTHQVIGGIRAVWPPFSDGHEIPGLVTAFRAAGAHGLDVYNFGLARREVLRQVR